MERGWLIGELSTQAGVSPQTIRFYEREGLLAPPQRNKSGYRLYPAESLTQLLFIQHSKQFGLTLEDIKHLVNLQTQGVNPCGSFRRLVQERLQTLAQQAKQLQATHQAIVQRFERLATQLPETDGAKGDDRTLADWLREAAHPTDVPALGGNGVGREQLIQRYMTGERDFQGLDLIQANLSGVNLSGADLSRAQLMLANLEEVVLEGANLGGANLTGANLHNANLSEAVLIGANLRDSNLEGASLWGANLSGADLTQARLHPDSLATANLWGTTLPDGQVYAPHLGSA